MEDDDDEQISEYSALRPNLPSYMATNNGSSGSSSSSWFRRKVKQSESTDNGS